MSDTRSEILDRIRNGMQNTDLPDAPAVHPGNDLPSVTGSIAQFIAEAEALSSTVLRVPAADEVAQTVIDLFTERGWSQALSWEFDTMTVPGLETMLNKAGITVHHTGDPHILESIPVGITGTHGALADTGTIIVRSGEGRSALASLLPPVHIALLDANSIQPDMATYWQRSGAAPAEVVRQTSNLIFISGPSRTADIEQTLTLGVHGPREVIIIIWGHISP